MAGMAGARKFIVTCLPNSNIVKQVYNDVESSLARDSIWIDCTSGNPSISKSLAEYSISKNQGISLTALFQADQQGHPKEN